MNIFYGSCKGKPDVPANSSIEATLDAALEIFRGLDARSGFLGINLGERFAVQFAPQKQRGVRVELLDTHGPAFDSCVADAQFAESLIRAAAEGQDVFRIARASNYEWEHLDMA